MHCAICFVIVFLVLSSTQLLLPFLKLLSFCCIVSRLIFCCRFPNIVCCPSSYHFLSSPFYLILKIVLFIMSSFLNFSPDNSSFFVVFWANVFLNLLSFVKFRPCVMLLSFYFYVFLMFCLYIFTVSFFIFHFFLENHVFIVCGFLFIVVFLKFVLDSF